MSNEYPWINEGGIDYVEVNNLVNPPNPANAGKVVGVGEDGKAALVEGGGGGLPTVTPEDNGDVLTVVDGAWAKAESVAGTEFFVDCGEIPETSGSFVPTPDKTFAEIEAAYKKGQLIIISFSQFGYRYYCNAIRTEGEEEEVAYITYSAKDQSVSIGQGVVFTEVAIWLNTEDGVEAHSGVITEIHAQPYNTST